jgi:hypothetical protein
MAFTDSFDRSTGLGSNWETVSGLAWYIEATNQWMKPKSTNLKTAVRVVGSFPNDHYAEVWVDIPLDTVPPSHTRSLCGPAVRVGATGDCYYVQFNIAGLGLYRRQGSVDTFLGDWAGTQPSDTFVKVKLEVIGTTLTVYVGGTLRLTRTDATLTSGNPGCAGLTGETALMPFFNDFASTDPGGAVVGAGLAIGGAVVLGVSQSVYVGVGSAVGSAAAQFQSNQPFTDNFNRSTGLGPNWATVEGNFNWDIIADTVLKPVSVFRHTGVRCVIGAFPDDQFSEFWTEVPTIVGSNKSLGGPAVRVGPTGDCYYVQFVKTGVALYRRQAAVDNYVGDATFTNPNDVMTKVRLEAIGTTLKVYVSDVLKLTRTDANITSGNPGAHSLTGETAYIPRYDDFSCTPSVASGIGVGSAVGAAIVTGFSSSSVGGGVGQKAEISERRRRAN